jgi:hypothetical protein
LLVQPARRRRDNDDAQRYENPTGSECSGEYDVRNDDRTFRSPPIRISFATAGGGRGRRPGANNNTARLERLRRNAFGPLRQSVATGCTAFGYGFLRRPRKSPQSLRRFRAVVAVVRFFSAQISHVTLPPRQPGALFAIDSAGPDGGVQGPSDEPVERQRGPVRR